MKKQTFARFLRAPLSLALAALMLCALFPVNALAVTINPSNSIDNVTLDGMYLGNSGNNVTVSNSGTIIPARLWPTTARSTDITLARLRTTTA